jgi:FkbM family methyltransferase
MSPRRAQSFVVANARRVSARLGPERFRREMSRVTPARGRIHGALQRAYQARQLHRFLRPHVRPGETVFDIGANTGEWTAEIRRLGGEVIAVEPQSECVAQLRSRFEGDPSVRVVEAAAADRDGEGVLHLAATGSAHASMSEEWRQAAIAHRGMPTDAWVGTERVTVTTLDSLIERFGVPGFCKIDVEGLEPQVLAGLSKPLPVVTFEFHHELGHAAERCAQFLENLGDYRYRIFLEEWPRKSGGELNQGALPAAIAALPSDAWGMILARLSAG